MSIRFRNAACRLSVRRVCGNKVLLENLLCNCIVDVLSRSNGATVHPPVGERLGVAEHCLRQLRLASPVRPVSNALRRRLVSSWRSCAADALVGRPVHPT